MYRRKPGALVFLLILAMSVVPAALAQTFHVLHTFSGFSDGARPVAGVNIDRAGNLYGTTYYGGKFGRNQGYGLVYKLAQKNSAWLLTPLYTFQWGDDGSHPVAAPVIAANGILYGTTQAGAGTGCYLGWGCGTAYKLQPGPGICSRTLCPWTETVLYRFNGAAQGGNPGYGDLTFDASGDIYGTTAVGGAVGGGIVFELQPSGGSWTEKIIHDFTSASDGIEPQWAVIFDSAGNLYGSTTGGGIGHGTLFELTPSGLSNWTYTLLHEFTDDGWAPNQLIWGPSGNLFGNTAIGGANGAGVIFELTRSGGTWTYQVIYDNVSGGFTGRLAVDPAGNLYGTNDMAGAFGKGSVFKLSNSNGVWTYTSLYDFTGGDDGCTPYGGVTLDVNGNLYGTTWGCGAADSGVVWQITP